MNFVVMVGSLVIALAVSKWYFTAPAERDAKIGNMEVVRSYHVAVRYHLGTVAFGALIIAVIQFIRAVVMYIEHHMKKSSIPKSITKFIFCCVNCCLLCLERFMRFVSKNAYIQTAIHGTGFMSSCKNAFFTIARNILLVGTLQVATSVALLLGKVFITALCTGLAYYFFTQYYADRMYGFVAPCMLIMLLSWIVAAVFMDVLHMSADTVLMSYISDCEAHHGTAVFADSHTHTFVKTYGVGASGPEAEKQERAMAEARDTAMQEEKERQTQTGLELASVPHTAL